MLIQPSQHTHTAYYAGAERSANATGVNQSSARAAIPPVEASGKEEAAHNQFLDTRETAGQGAGELQGDESSAPEQASGDDLDSNVAQESNTKAKTKAKTQVEQQQLEDEVLVDQLKARDREVRVHEAAHASVGGQYAGSPNFEYTRGPDGKNYATGGEVSISVSEANDPQATIEKARVIQAAALAPAQPSSQDRQVAAQAARMELNAQAELQQEQAAEAKAERQTEKEKADESADAGKDSDSASDTNSTATEAYLQAGKLGSNEFGETASADAKSGGDSSQAVTSTNNVSSNSSKPVSAYVQQLQQQGPSDLQNPYGKSGQLNILA